MNTPNLFGWIDDSAVERGGRARTNTTIVEARTENVGPRGLIVRDPYASQILNGQKIWEIRGRPTQIRGPVAIVKGGTGHVYGTANLVRVLGPLEIEDLEHAPELPQGERQEIVQQGLPYPKTFAYVFTNPKWFEYPIPYRHANGAVTWVRLPDLDLKAVRYAASPLGVNQLSLG
jgi:hypothetical protein